MLKFSFAAISILMAAEQAVLPAPTPDAFVKIPSTLTEPGAPFRLNAFELAACPVTNAEYRVFVQSTGAAPPPHWPHGAIPAGWENYPVVFVNRYDVEKYLRWRSRKENRIYRLPTGPEFDYASRGGDFKARYPWGSQDPEGRANYDPDGTRSYGDWRRYLEPVAKRQPNAWGLYDMAGNVWQMVDSFPFPAPDDYVYRVETPESREHRVMGGSWFRPARYLQCGAGGAADSGMRHPDLGFRLAREAEGTLNDHRQPRRVAALPATDGAVFISWQLLPQDAPAAGFHVYRSTRRDDAGERITITPVADSTNWIDHQPPRRERLFYRVRALLPDGREGAPSEWAAVAPGAAPSHLAGKWKPAVVTGGFTPTFGDLDGDGALDVVFRLDNGLAERRPDTGKWVEIEAMTSYGKSLWRVPIASHEIAYGNPNNMPVVVWDLDGDGKAEVICRMEDNHQAWLAVLDGMTGHVLRKTPWQKMATDFSKSSSRIHMAIAYLDGKMPSIITQTGLYENEILDAYDTHLNKLWTFRSTMETSGSGSHHIDIADVDGDGRDEVFDGTTLLNPDGKMRWSIYRSHPDIVQVKHVLPDLPGRQVYYGVETTDNAGPYVVDAGTGKVIWKHNHDDDPTWTHSHVGWAADIWEGSPGMELLNNRDGHLAKDLVLLSADGKILMEPFPQGWRPVNWTGGKVRDLFSPDGRRLGHFNGKAVDTLQVPPPADLPGGSCQMTADLIGDYRDELVCTGKDTDGSPLLLLYTNTDLIQNREVTHTASHEYALWLARNFGGGYNAYFEWQP